MHPLHYSSRCKGILYDIHHRSSRDGPYRRNRLALKYESLVLLTVDREVEDATAAILLFMNQKVMECLSHQDNSDPAS
jgi:hypothetical protein